MNMGSKSDEYIFDWFRNCGPQCEDDLIVRHNPESIERLVSEGSLEELIGISGRTWYCLPETETAIARKNSVEGKSLLAVLKIKEDLKERISFNLILKWKYIIMESHA